MLLTRLTVGRYLDSLYEYGYLERDYVHRYSLSDDGATYHLVPNGCDGVRTKSRHRGTRDDIHREHPGRQPCMCVGDDAAPWGGRLPEPVRTQLLWLVNAYEQVAIGPGALRHLNELLLLRPADGPNPDVNAGLAQRVDQLADTARSLRESPAVRQDRAHQLTRGALLYAGWRDQRLPIVDEAEADPLGSYGKSTELPLPTNVGGELTPAQLEECERAHAWATVTMADLMGHEFAHMDPFGDGYRNEDPFYLVRIPASVAIVAALTNGQILGLDDGYSVADVAATLPLLGPGTTLSAAMDALRAARH